MKQRRFEIFVAVILTVICYFGNFYLKEPAIPGVTLYSLTWHLLNVFWLFMMIVIGYWGLSKHEVKWIRASWVIVNLVFLLILFANKLMRHFWRHDFLPEATSTLVRTPFFFLFAAYIPRWFNRWNTSIQK